MRKRTDILSPGDVKEGEVILALLFRAKGKPAEAHLIKICNDKGGKSKRAIKRLIEGDDMWHSIQETFLHHMGRR